MRGKSSIGFSGFEKFRFLMKILKIRKISKIWKNEEGAPALRVIRAGTRLTVHRSLPYSSFSKSNTETVAKPGRLGPAQKGKLMDFLSELAMFCIMLENKSHRISCPEYIEDFDKCIQMYKRQCHGQIYDISGPRKI